MRHLTASAAILALAACNGSGSFGVPKEPGSDTGLPTTNTPTTGTTGGTTTPGTATGTATGTSTGTATGTGTGTATGTATGTGTGTGTPGIDADWVVDCNGTGDFVTIQEAIDAAVSGERIGVLACTYHERIDYLGKMLDVFGVDGSATTIIDGDEQGTVVNVESGEPDGTRLAGFTITDGWDNDDGSAIQIEMSSLDLEDVVMTGNDTSWSVLYAHTGWVRMKDVVIDDNDVMDGEQAIYAKSGSMTAHNLYVDCSGGAHALWHHNALVLTGSTLTCATGDGMYDYHGEDSIRRSVLTGSVSGLTAHDTESTDEEPDNPNERLNVFNSIIGGGDYGMDVAYMDVTIRNATVAGGDAALRMVECQPFGEASSSLFMGGICGVEGDEPFTVSYSAFWGNVEDGCGVDVFPVTTADPLFVSFPTDLHLGAGSPLIDAGDPDNDWDDTDGTRNDIGAYGGPNPMP